LTDLIHSKQCMLQRRNQIYHRKIMNRVGRSTLYKRTIQYIQLLCTLHFEVQYLRVHTLTVLPGQIIPGAIQVKALAGPVA